MSISNERMMNLRVVRECAECGAGPVGAHPAGGVWVCGACGGPVYEGGSGVSDDPEIRLLKRVKFKAVVWESWGEK